MSNATAPTRSTRTIRPTRAELRQGMDAPFATSIHLAGEVLATTQATPAELATLAKCKPHEPGNGIDPEYLLMRGIAGRAALLALRTLAK